MRFFGWVILGLVLSACATSAEPLPDEDGGDGGVATDTGGPCTPCDGGCADLKTDPSNCGKCGKVCPMGASCVQGSCQCPSGQSTCNNACTDTKTSLEHCGKCGGPDAGPIMGGGMWACTNGVCGVVCPMSDGGTVKECGGTCVDTSSSVDHCGDCNTACDAMTEQCMQGLCCKNGQQVCPGDAGPACTDVKNDANNCGMCGKTCSGNTPACANGTCVSCGNDCWSAQGCLTKGGHCVRFACRAGNAGTSFCNACMGWTEITYNEWMNGGYCKDVHEAYYNQNPGKAMCGGSPSCCSTQANCGSGNVAWHFHDGSNNRFTGPSLSSTPQAANCMTYNGTDNSAYTRLSACKKSEGSSGLS